MKLLFFLLTFTFLVHAQQSTTYKEEVEKLYTEAYKHIYVNNDSANFYLKKIENIALKKQDWNTVFEALISSSHNASSFYDLQTTSSNLKTLDSLIANEPNIWDTIEDPLLYQNSINYDKGNYYFKIGDFEKAKTFFKTIYNSYENSTYENLTKDHFYLFSVSISFLAKIYDLEGKLNLSKDYYLENIHLIKIITPDDLSNLYINYALLADVLKKQGEIKKANLYLKQTLKYALIKNDNPNRIITVANNLAKNHLLLEQQDSSLHYLSLMQKNIYRSPHFEYLLHLTQGKLEQTNGNTLTAISKINEALNSYKKTRKKYDKNTLSYIYKEKALYSENNNHKDALNLINIALETINTEFGSMYLELITLKTKSLYKLKKYEDANTIAYSAIKSLDNFKSDYQYSTDKINLVENTFPLFEYALNANYNLYKKTGDKKYIERSFFLMEKSKSVLLIDALQASKANKFSTVPDSLLEKERRLRIEITSIEKELKVAKSTDEKLNNKIFKLKQEQSNTIDYLSKNYPDYHELRYKSNVIDIASVTNEITKDQTLISYFYGDKAIYVISIGQDEQRFIKIDNAKKIEQQLKQYYALIADPNSNRPDLDNLSNILYQKIVSSSIISKTKRIVIIPDGPINFLPFGTLIDSKKEQKFLIHKYSISYSNSATLLSKLWKNKTSKKRILAFAPSFNGEFVDPTTTRDKLTTLPHNTTEVNNITTLFDGKSLIGPKATLSNFNKNVGEFGILHFATHATFNNELPEYSYLAFSPKEKEENLLYIKDLYNLKLQANLVTLSACETTIGDLKRGEGFIGLAHGFFYAGAKSLTSTLWKVNDASTAKLMADYYTILAKNTPKDIALQTAKVNFLKVNKDNALSHPYYWSGFILSGNYEPLDTGINWIWVLAPALVFLIILVFLYKHRTKKANLIP